MLGDAMNPPANETTFAELIRRCVEQQGNDDWVAFRARTETLVHTVFLHYCHCGHLVDEFEDWFYGWLAAGHQLAAALNALHNHYPDPEHIYIAAREQYAWRYFRRIVQTGCAVFLGEINSHLPVAPDVDPDNTPGHNPWQAIAEQLEIAEQMEQVRAVACQLSTNLRLTFSLRHFEWFWPLLESDVSELRKRNALRPDWLEQRLHAFHACAPSCSDIGGVLGVSTDSVYQFYRRALLWIYEQLGPPA